MQPVEPTPPLRPGQEELTARPIAHRGLHGSEVPENSLAAFEAAAQAGYAIECDVRVSAEGVPLVFHDHTLARMCQLSGTVERVTRALLPGIRLGASEEGIPTLGQVLRLVAGRVPLFVDLQLPPGWSSLRSWRRVCEAAAADLRSYDGVVGVMSWDPRQLRWFAAHLPGVLRIQSGGVVSEVALLPGVAWLVDSLRIARLARPDAISYNAARLPRRPVSRARAAGVPVLAWTVRSPSDLARLAGCADNVIFESFRPSTVASEALRAQPAPGWTARLAHRARGWWAGMRRAERATLLLAAASVIVLSALFSGTSSGADLALVPSSLTGAAGLAAVLPRRWLVIAATAGGSPTLGAVLPDRHLGLVVLPAAFAASLLGAVLRCVRLPRGA